MPQETTHEHYKKIVLTPPNGIENDHTDEQTQQTQQTQHNEKCTNATQTNDIEIDPMEEQ